MAMGKRRQRERQEDLWIATSEVVRTPSNAFYERFNEILDANKFDLKVEHLCRRYYTGFGQRFGVGKPRRLQGVMTCFCQSWKLLGTFWGNPIPSWLTVVAFLTALVGFPRRDSVLWATSE